MLIDVNRLKELVSKEDTIKKLREVFRREETLRAVKGILSGALGVALAYIPFSIPCLLLAQVTAEIFPEEFVERVKRVLKAPKEEDLLKEIKGEIEKNGELRKILIDLLKEVLRGLENFSSEDVRRMLDALSETAEMFPELKERISNMERELEGLKKTVEDHERRIRELERLERVPFETYRPIADKILHIGSSERVAEVEKKVTKLLIGDYQYHVKTVPLVLTLGRCDPPDPQSSKPSHLCVRDEEGNVLHHFEDLICLWGCPRPDAPEGCCHRRHVEIEIRESIVSLRKAGKYPLYECTESGYREVDQLELRVGEKALISLSGLRWHGARRERCTGMLPCIEVSVV